jgi:predicted RNA-binding Zn ribbon-like protein
MDSKLQKNDLWLDLLNSDWHDFKGGGRHEDRLDSDAWLERFLLPWSGMLGHIPLPMVRGQLKDLRSLLRRMAEGFAARKSLRRADLERLNGVLGSSPEVRKISRSGRSYLLHYEKKCSGLPPMLAEIASSFADILAHGEPGRIKICRNPDCLWIFYDTSKNRSRKWCENATGCGNLMKVRLFRARARQKS